ncbi:MAG: tetratricopeptide repeat protein [Acidobacteria bacterium]|nr:tetratricopeptide repeat protein [Acidobacteriota bacterium]
MREQLGILLLFYRAPIRAVSEALDNAGLGRAVLFALLTALLLYAPAQRDRQRIVMERAAVPAAENPAGASTATPYRWGLPPRSAFVELLLIAGLYVPLTIAGIILFEGRPRAMTILQEEYGPLLMCTAMAWTAARLPAAIVLMLAPAQAVVIKGWVYTASTICFLLFSACCLRTALGSRWNSAALMATGGGGLMALGPAVSAGLAPIFYLLLSPWLLFLFWGRIGASAGAIGSSVSSRQSFQRGIRASTINEKDADSHYQLGLIQMKRRNWVEAEACFRRALQIDADDFDYHFHLGRSLREQQRYREALESLQQSARLNDKASHSEVWREIGATQIALEMWPDSLASLERYVLRREYDPEGLVYLGESLHRAGRDREARQMFERAVESVETMPSHRRGEVREWARRAKAGLKRVAS